MGETITETTETTIKDAGVGIPVIPTVVKIEKDKGKTVTETTTTTVKTEEE